MDRRTRIRWDRLGRWALVGVFAFVLLLYVGPAARWVSTYRQAKEKRSEVAQLQAQNRSLRRRQGLERKERWYRRELRCVGARWGGESYLRTRASGPAVRIEGVCGF